MPDCSLLHPQPDDDELLTTAEAAPLCRKAPLTLRRWRTKGEGPPFLKLNARTVLYRRGALRAWLAAHERQPLARHQEGAAA